MYKILFSLLPAVVIIAACSSTKQLKSTMVKQGIVGYVYETKGNQMPYPGMPPATASPVQTTIFIYEPTNISQVQREGTSAFYKTVNTKQIDSVMTDSTGKFSVALPIGTYSLFVKINGKFYANSYNQKNDINLYSVEDGKVTDAKITVSYAATF